MYVPAGATWQLYRCICKDLLILSSRLGILYTGQVKHVNSGIKTHNMLSDLFLTFFRFMHVRRCLTNSKGWPVTASFKYRVACGHHRTEFVAKEVYEPVASSHCVETQASLEISYDGSVGNHLLFLCSRLNRKCPSGTSSLGDTFETQSADPGFCLLRRAVV